jgi:hypothetical protein
LPALPASTGIDFPFCVRAQWKRPAQLGSLQSTGRRLLIALTLRLSARERCQYVVLSAQDRALLLSQQHAGHDSSFSVTHRSDPRAVFCLRVTGDV